MGRPTKEATVLKLIQDTASKLSTLGHEVEAEKLLGIYHDMIRDKVFSTTADVYFVDTHTGEAVKVSNNQSDYIRLKVEQPETYEFFKRKMLEFLGSFSDNSIFVKMYGKHGEKLFIGDEL